MHLKRLLVIGAGSIGRRHYKLAKEQLLAPSVALLSRHKNDAEYHDLAFALEDFDPTHILVASPTSEHIENFSIIEEKVKNKEILIEKPLFNNYISPNFLKNIYFVAYNLRFHPLIKLLKEITNKDKILHAEIYVGSYLPKWRSNIDYTNSYSAKKNLGGGVLRDLSHELDYIFYFFGKIKRVVSIVSKVSSLQIETEDLVSMVLETESNVIISVTMNYVSRLPVRRITMISDQETYVADVINSTFITSCENKKFDFSVGETYKDQLLSFLEDKNNLCTFSEGLYVVQLIELIEKSSSQKGWINL